MIAWRAALPVVLPLLAALGAGPASAAERPTRVEIADELVVEALTDEIWLYRATFELGGRPVESNGLLIRGSAGVVVVDTPWDDGLTGLLLDWVKAALGEVRALVATHFHPDRLGGIGEVHRRGIASYGHEETARLGAADGLEPPRHAFSDSLTLSEGGRPIELWHPGPGHSVDNIVVWLPDERILFGGCMVKSLRSTSLGFTGDAAIESWAASLEALLERYPDAGDVVPGHGGIGDLEAIRHTRELVLEHQARQTPAVAGRQSGANRAERVIRGRFGGA